MNLVVIVLDTYRYDHIAANGNETIDTPNLDRLTETSWAFDYSFAASYPTIPHRTDALTGRYGAPFHPWKPLDCDVLTLPRVLADHGYCTQLIHDTPHLVNGGHNFDYPFHAWTPIRGAEVDRPWITDSPHYPSNWGRDPLFDDYPWDDAAFHNNTATYIYANQKRKQLEDWNCARLFKTAARFLRDNARRDNFFLWLDGFDPHEPWDAPPEFVKRYDQDSDFDGRLDPRSVLDSVRNDPNLPQPCRDRIAAFYAAKATWVDHWLGHFLDVLDQTGLARRTALLLTADHGTNVGERGRFGKSYPVREQEARTPFTVRHPDGDAGRSDLIVQPQDVFATAMGLLELPVPEGIDSHDVRALACEGQAGPRQIALAGRNAGPQWAEEDARVLCTVFDREWYLEMTADPQHSRLTRLGELTDVAAEHSDVAARLRQQGIGELARRGTDERLIAWIESEGRADFPADAQFTDAHPAPATWHSYFGRIYHGGVPGQTEG
jgi:arylsulfatase A-like enzyme